MKLPSLMLVTKDKRTNDLFYHQIMDFFEGNINIIRHQDFNRYDEVDIILVSSPQLIQDHLPADKIIIGRRSINVEVVEQLVSLPEQTECLVINNIAETTFDCIEYLSNLGLNLKFYPYFPGMEGGFKKTKVAIIPMALEMVPKGIEKIIDIGLRPLDLSTLIELGSRLQYNLDTAHIYAAKYIKEIISLTSRLSNLLQDVNDLNHKLDAILNTVHDGIIATDEAKKIIKINNSAKKILGLTIEEEQLKGTKFDEVFPKLAIKKEDNIENQLVSINEKKLVVNKVSIMSDKKNIGDVTAFQDVTRIQHLEQDIRKKIQNKGFSSRYTTENIIGESRRIKETLRIMEKIGKNDNTVLILGENGTGKELFAHSIHNMSMRKNGPFIPVNFAGLPESLAESELFGYEDGTFTGASKGGKQGLFELAHNGTIFLDEIGDASLSLQILLLRVLQEKQVMRVGGRSIIPVNVRVIAATNKDLKNLVKSGKFREDLYYRLFILPLRIPTLRERREDIPILINTFIKDYSSSIPKIDDEVMERLFEYQWPGNIRELLSVIQYMTIVMEGNRITKNDLPEQFKQANDTATEGTSEVISLLKQEGDLGEFASILNCLYEAKQQRVNYGRGKIVEYLQVNNCSLSEQQVRRRMEVLRNLNLIYSGNKGQGSKITEDGMDILGMLNHYKKQETQPVI